MSARLPYTPTSRIRQSLRLLWLRSRERAAALRQTGYQCCYCGRKQSTAKGRECKLEVHHLDGCQWEQAIEAIRKHILQTPDRLAPACSDCHAKLTRPASGPESPTAGDPPAGGVETRADGRSGVVGHSSEQGDHGTNAPHQVRAVASRPECGCSVSGLKGGKT